MSLSISSLRCLALALAAFLAAPGAASAQEDRLSGVTLGVFIGLAVLDSTVDIPGTNTRPAMRFVDQGGDGMIFGARLGYGRLLGEGIYLGAEIEGLLPINVTSRLNAAGAEYRARLRQEVAPMPASAIRWTGAACCICAVA